MNKKYKLKLNCFCESKNSKLLFYYKKKPNKETDFKIKKKEYFRKYKICKICKHVYGEHNINLNSITKESKVYSFIVRDDFLRHLNAILIRWLEKLARTYKATIN